MSIKLNYIYRAQNNDFFSIEKVFDTVKQEVEMQQRYAVSTTYLTTQVNGISAIIKNLFYLYKSSNADIYHITGDVHFAVLALPFHKTILTIHDCVFLQHSNPIKRSVIKFLYLTIPLRLARYITVISETTKQEILQHSSVNPDKIVVIPNPIVTKFQYSPKEFNAQCPRILQIGTKTNKNLQNLIPALHLISCELVIIGALSDEIIALLAQYNINYISLLHISNKELELEYEKCDIVSFVSTYEGFGLPILEAQQVGRVVITSNQNPMKEVAGEGAVLVNANEVPAIRKGILELIQNQDLRADLIHKGQGNIVRFSPQIIAKEYMKLYDEMRTK